MTSCRSCKAAVELDARFCSSCGCEGPVERSPRFCNECGSPTAPTDAFCGECGKQLNHRQAPPAPRATPQRSGTQATGEQAVADQRGPASVLWPRTIIGNLLFLLILLAAWFKLTPHVGEFAAGWETLANLVSDLSPEAASLAFNVSAVLVAYLGLVGIRILGRMLGVLGRPTPTSKLAEKSPQGGAFMGVFVVIVMVVISAAVKRYARKVMEDRNRSQESERIDREVLQRLQRKIGTSTRAPNSGTNRSLHRGLHEN